MIQEKSIRNPTVPEPKEPALGNWREALQELLSARIAIIQMEAGPAIEAIVIKVVLFCSVAITLLITWLLVVAGTIGLIVRYAFWPWWAATLAIAAGHLFIAIILLLIVKSKKSTPFPITRQEFKKDQEWLNHLKQKPKQQS